MNTNDTFHAGLLVVSALGLLAIATVGTTPVQAAEAQAAQTEVRVSFNREELSDPKAVERLYHNLRQASAKVCDASHTRNGDLQSYSQWQVCYRQTLHDAIAQVDSPVLLAMYNGKKGAQG